jgi:predicted GNAT family N-acyltransferase
MRELEYLAVDFDGPYHDSIVKLRYEVFVDEQKVPVEIELDDHDPVCGHLVAVDADKVVGTLRMIDSDKTMRIGRLCVKADTRHRGIASRLMEMALSHARKSKYKNVVLDSQIDTIAFYEAFGFLAQGPVFDDGGIDHRKMVLAL